MSAKTKTRYLLIAGAFSVLLVTTAAQLWPAPRGTGKEWLSWSPEQRSVYVDAYLTGYLRGKTDACIAAAELFELHKPIDLKNTVDGRCFRHAKSYSKGGDYYTSVLTGFYTKYPEYRNIPDDYLMLVLTDDRYKTAEEIYRAAVKGEIRTNF